MYKSEFRSGVWNHPTDFNQSFSPVGTDSSRFDVEMSGSGKTIIVWVQQDTSFNTQIFVSEFNLIGGWTHPNPLDPDDNISPDGFDIYNSPRVLLNNNGDAAIAWNQAVGGGIRQVFTAQYDSLNGWRIPANINDFHSIPSRNTSEPNLAINNNGNIILTWVQSQPVTNRFRVLKRAYDPISGWEPVPDFTQALSPAGLSASAPQAFSNDNGNILVVYKGYVTTFHLYKAEFDPIGGWTTATDENDSINFQSSQVNSWSAHMSRNGAAIISWDQSDGHDYQIYFSENQGNGWINPNDLTDSISPKTQIIYDIKGATNNHGEAIVAWRQFDGTEDHIFKSEYRNGQWLHPQDLTDYISLPGGASTYLSNVALAENGEAIILWHQSMPAPVFSAMYKAEYRGGNWTIPLSDNDYFIKDSLGLRPVMSSNGNTLIAWKGYDNNSNERIYKAEYRSLSGWTLPADIDDGVSPLNSDVSSFHFAMNSNSEAVILWALDDGLIYQTTSNGVSWAAPSAISGASASVSSPQVDINDNGQIIAIWHQSIGGFQSIVKSERVKNVWTSPITISQAGVSMSNPLVRLNNKGEALVTWRRTSGGLTSLYRAESKSGNWTVPQDVSDFIVQAKNLTNIQMASGNDYKAIIWVINTGQLRGVEHKKSQWSPMSVTNTSTTEYNLQCSSNSNCLLISKRNDSNPFNSGLNYQFLSE